MIRSLATTVLALLLAAPAAPVHAQDDLARQLINSCVGCRLPHDLHGRDLHGLRFVGSDLHDTDLSHANLRGAEFTGANLDGTRFDDADLRDARFVGVRLRHTSFARANVEGVRFVGASVSQGDLDGPLGRTILRDCTGCSFAGADLHDADLRGIKIVGANLHDSNLAGARLNDARLVGINAHGSDFSRTDLRGADLVGANLHDARMNGATIGDAVLCSRNDDDGDVVFSGDDGGYRRTSCANLRGVDLHGLDFRAARYCAGRTSARDGQDFRDVCRPVTRQELIDDAHANLTGALAPA
ncbi:MAG: pentapeptide repeat-containing protein [Candidatus Eremiobacteraeota bacterium]|nr:pentapeptide repeat-containing protein [Candidatus Eremiobacteraeota bacterium]MBV8643426.1 pentapeptide repeat-containing protein [Candidatus Eremiobacteraeota bacterium]